MLLDSRFLFSLISLSSACALAYQVIWLRLATVSFGVISPVFATFISTFMLGLYLGPKLVSYFPRTLNTIRALALVELFIFSGSLIVPRLFRFSESYIFSSTEDNLLPTLLTIFIILLPWVSAIGATLPLTLEIASSICSVTKKRFSYVYLANICGAVLGTLLTAFVLIESLGLSGSLFCAGLVNIIIATVWFILSTRYLIKQKTEFFQSAKLSSSTSLSLFWLGLSGLAMEFFWVRTFTPILGNTIYTFALIVSTYLVAIFMGAAYFRYCERPSEIQDTFGLMVIFILIPLIFPFHLYSAFWPLTLISIAPLSFLFGYATTQLIEETESHAHPHAYAINSLGSMFGPLLAGFLLLPYASLKISTGFIAVGFLLFYLLWRRRKISVSEVTVCSIFLMTMLLAPNNDEVIPNESTKKIVLRDHTFTVIGAVQPDNRKFLFVNGIYTAVDSRLTKNMAHLPIAIHSGKPEKGLVICLGVGNTMMSMRSWGLDTTAVELSPSVIKALPFFLSSETSALKDEKVRIVSDDGRRFLRFTNDKYDIITIDPPPPVEAGYSSLLYSEDFYVLAKSRLQKGGVLQQWVPDTVEEVILENHNTKYHRSGAFGSILKAMTNVFSHVRVFSSVNDFGYHILASDGPLEKITPRTMLGKMPEDALKDLMKDNKSISPERYAEDILSRELSTSELLNNRHVGLTDDRPINEYFFLRRLLGPDQP